jgi:hypothetical protein
MGQPKKRLKRQLPGLPESSILGLSLRLCERTFLLDNYLVADVRGRHERWHAVPTPMYQDYGIRVSD